MFSSLFRIGLTAALFGLLFVPGVSFAQDKRIRHVQDDAKLFSKDAIASANAVITKIKEKHKKDLLIETVAEGPDKDFNAWANQRFNNSAVDGVYVVLVKKPKKYHIDVGDQTLSKGYFTRADIKELESIIKKKGNDKELLSAIATFTLETMNERHKPAKVVQPAPRERPVPAERPAPAPVVHNEKENSMPPWVGWVCMIVAILFVVWVVFAIIRALTNMGGGGGYGYGGGGYGYGGGGGGGGFFTGMLGGLFGAMAGMWIYNSMFGGHAAYRNDGSVDWGGGGGASGSGGETYQGDSDVGASAGGDADGGDWGGGGGGGDAGGGGGGDWGGGGGEDAGGGGGDWGGGGDAGGGGGDWGGGGGGDWGGGGGDFGGGGGGDW